MKVLSQAPHALGMVLKRGRSQRPGTGKDHLYVRFEDNAGRWRVVALCQLLIGGSDFGGSESGDSFKSQNLSCIFSLLRLIVFYSCRSPIQQPILLDACSTNSLTPNWLRRSSSSDICSICGLRLQNAGLELLAIERQEIVHLTVC